MSLYNMINGVNNATFLVLPVLGKHPDEYPRFRDAFYVDPNQDFESEQEDDPWQTAGKILVLTRTGGGNREDYVAENDAIRKIPGYVRDFDAAWDSTYSYWVFDVPERWKADVLLINEGRVSEVSQEYVEMLIGVFPKIEHRLREIFSRTTTETEDAP